MSKLAKHVKLYAISYVECIDCVLNYLACLSLVLHCNPSGTKDRVDCLLVTTSSLIW